MRRCSLWLLVLSLLACGREPPVGVDAGLDTAAPPDMTLDTSVDGAMDARPTSPDSGVDGALAERTDAAAFAADARTPVRDLGRPEPADAGAGVVVVDCIDACARLAGCGGLDGRFDDDEHCRLECAATPQDAQFEWFGCMLARDCAAVVTCELPAPGIPCPAACEALARCGAPYDGERCRARCAEAPYRFGRCVQELGDGCALSATVDCLAREALPGCHSLCQSAAGCRGAANAECPPTCVDCKATCVERRLSADPLAPLFARRQLRCYGWAAETCDDLETCIDQAVVDDGPPATAFAFCTAWAGCDGAGPCDAALERLAMGGPPALECAVDALSELCAEPVDVGDLGAAIDRCAAGLGPQIDAACVALDEARAACGLAGPAVDVCIGGDGALTETRLARAGLVCLGEADCAAFAACLDAATPADRCAAGCERAAACPGASDFACDAACPETWTHRRTQRHLRCLADAPDCEALLAACPAPAPPPCVDVCARLDGCGLADADCRLICDDDALFAPDAHRGLRACVDAAADCDAMAGCLAIP